MIVFGKRNYKELCESLMIPGVGIVTTYYWFLPIYRVKINYDK